MTKQPAPYTTARIPPEHPRMVASADHRQALAAHYPAITETAEHLIRALVGRGTTESRGAALGVWQLWYGLTVGWQQDGDSERLEQMVFPTTEASHHEPA